MSLPALPLPFECHKSHCLQLEDSFHRNNALFCMNRDVTAKPDSHLHLPACHGPSKADPDSDDFAGMSSRP